MISQYGKLIINIAEQSLAQPTGLRRRFSEHFRLSEFINLLKPSVMPRPAGEAQRPV